MCFGLYSTSGVTFSLRGVNISNTGDGRVLITDINPNGDNDEDALICRSEIPVSDTHSSRGDWYLHPTMMSTDEADRIDPIKSVIHIILDRGWDRNRDEGEDHELLVYRVVRLKRASDTAEEGVFTCNINGDINSPRYHGIYYPSE